jgi:hypothetical protein
VSTVTASENAERDARVSADCSEEEEEKQNDLREGFRFPLPSLFL